MRKQERRGAYIPICNIYPKNEETRARISSRLAHVLTPYNIYFVICIARLSKLRALELGNRIAFVLALASYIRTNVLFIISLCAHIRQASWPTYIRRTPIHTSNSHTYSIARSTSPYGIRVYECYTIAEIQRTKLREPSDRLLNTNRSTRWTDSVC